MDRVTLLAMLRVKDVSWYFVAREAQKPGGLERLLAYSALEDSPDADRSLQLLRKAAPSRAEREHEVQAMLSSTEGEGTGLTTVLDDTFPVNLRTIFNLPPFLFYRGELRPDDAHSVSVVGTRMPTDDGLTRARRMASLLARHGVTVLSGLARGIDTAAHEACLNGGGRTIAVLGSGIRRIYPPENSELACRIAATGAVVSQFWPDTAPTSYTFPRRNIVTSGMGQGTVVIEATRSSGAKMQARYAIEHGKQVFLLNSLVASQDWARKYLSRPRVYEVSEVEEIIRMLRTPEEQRERAEQRVQLPLALN